METFIRCGNPNSWLIWALFSPILESSTVVTFSWSLQCDYWLFTRVHITFKQVQQDTFLNGYFVGHHPERHWNVQYLQSFSFCWRENSKVIFLARLRFAPLLKKLFSISFSLYVIIMSRTRFRVNLHSIVAWMSRNSSLETSAISEV